MRDSKPALLRLGKDARFAGIDGDGVFSVRLNKITICREPPRFDKLDDHTASLKKLLLAARQNSFRLTFVRNRPLNLTPPPKKILRLFLGTPGG